MFGSGIYNRNIKTYTNGPLKQEQTPQLVSENECLLCVMKCLSPAMTGTSVTEAEVSKVCSPNSFL